MTANNVTSTSGTDANGSYVAVTVTYQFTTFSSYLGFGTVNLSRTVTMRVLPAIPNFS